MKKIFFVLIIIFLLLVIIETGFAIKYYKQTVKLNNEIAQLNRNILKISSENKKLVKDNDSYKQMIEINYPIDLELQNCISKNSTTAGINNCVYAGIDSWEKETHKYVSVIKQKLPPNSLFLFEKSQSYWENHYNNEQKLIYDTIFNKTGTIHTNIAVGYVYDLIKKRALYLKSFLEKLSEN